MDDPLKDDAEYRFCYRCRLCDTTFHNAGIIGNNVQVAIIIANNENEVQDNHVHFCTNGSIGVADFIGAKRI